MYKLYNYINIYAHKNIKNTCMRIYEIHNKYQNKETSKYLIN